MPLAGKGMDWEAGGSFVSHAQRFLIEARKPG